MASIENISIAMFDRHGYVVVLWIRGCEVRGEQTGVLG
jgi:hypothetical protein